MNPIKKLCTQAAATPVVLQGNIAFATGCVRCGIHAVDGYPGTPSTEVIDRGLSQVQEMITVGWSVNEAAASAMGFGHSLGGNDCVVTMKIPGLFQAGDPFASAAFFNADRGALVYYVATDFTPSSTQHLVDPRPFIRSCFTPIFEPRNHQELHDAAEIAADLSRQFSSPVVILVSGTLCHSEGLVRLNPIKTRKKNGGTGSLQGFNTLPAPARINYDRVINERMPALRTFVEQSPLNLWEKGAGRIGVITCGIGDLMVREVKESLNVDIDLLSLAFTNPLPEDLITRFCASIDGPIHIIEDGSRCLEDAVRRLGITPQGKESDSLTEWTPLLVAEKLGCAVEKMAAPPVQPLMRPPMICPGCPYRLFGETVRRMKKQKKIENVIGDIGCNTLLFFMDALDTNLCMGASEANRAGYVLAQPEKAAKCLSLIGDGTETHSGLDATRNTLFRQVPGVKVILDNNWTAMTGGQPGPTSPVNLAGQTNSFDLHKALEAYGAKVLEADSYDRKGVQKVLTEALACADNGEFVTVILSGVCIRKMPKSAMHTRMRIDPELCVRCGMCQICPGTEQEKGEVPIYNTNCTGCASQPAACAQMCPKGAISPIPVDEMKKAAAPELPAAPEEITPPAVTSLSLPDRIAVAIRGVGGQGNLFFGKVLTRMAFLAGYGDTNVVKGETHGMAQMGGPVISTFCCGRVRSPVLLPGTADCLVAMEKSEILRPGFIDMIRPEGTVLIADTRVFPYGIGEDQYPREEAIEEALEAYRVVEVDVLGRALSLGDTTGRSANVVMIGALSALAPFDAFPEELWLAALKQISLNAQIWSANYAAFNIGREAVAAVAAR